MESVPGFPLSAGNWLSRTREPGWSMRLKERSGEGVFLLSPLPEVNEATCYLVASDSLSANRQRNKLKKFTIWTADRVIDRIRPSILLSH